MTFTYVNPGTEFHLSNGRTILMAEDGTYWVTPKEWQSIMRQPGVTRVERSG